MFFNVCRKLLNFNFKHNLNNVNTLRQARSISDLKRFYKDVTVAQGEGGFEVNLDRKKLKTPLGKLFLVPNEALSLAVAQEWDGQKDTIKRHGMHMTSLCNTAIDNPTHRDKETVIDALLDYLETDTVLYQLDEPEELASLQREHWQPLIDYINERYDVKIAPTKSIGVPELPEMALTAFRKHLNSFSKWHLVGYTQCVENLKSLIIATCLLDRRLNVEQAVFLSRLESEYQTSKWGSVEWHHDVEMHDLRARVSAATLFFHLSIENDRTIYRKSDHLKPV